MLACVPLRPQVRQVVVPAAEATGPCKARALAQSLWDGEEYVLQLDSHMRCVGGVGPAGGVAPAQRDGEGIAHVAAGGVG